MTATRRQHVVLCEGYDDRSFWKGWLLHLGCFDPTKGGRRPVADARGHEVGQGRFLFHTPGGTDVIVQPFHGRRRAKDAAAQYLGHHVPFLPTRLLLNLDGDSEDPTDSSADDQIRGIVRSLGGTADGAPPYRVRETIVSPVIWRCDDPPSTPGLPPQQTLERLAAAAIRAAHPERGPTVGDWLAAPPIGLSLPRSFGHSYFAKWYSDHGASDSYECLWREPAVAGELERRLRASDAWGTVVELVDD